MRLCNSLDEGHRQYKYDILLWIIHLTVFASRRRKWVLFVFLDIYRDQQNKILKFFI